MFKITAQITGYLLLFLECVLFYILVASPFLFLTFITLEEAYFLSVAFWASIACLTLWFMVTAIIIDVKKWGENK
tara:strand:- start:1474 stop:1698 length:225 start_codon:yes stop_codon:yes gene_type:complete